MMLANGLEEAFVGVAHRYGFSVPVAAYDREKCIEILMRDGGTREEAEDFFEYNTLGAWVGDSTPLFIQPMTLKEATEWVDE
jgi:hypothetical protein